MTLRTLPGSVRPKAAGLRFRLSSVQLRVASIALGGAAGALARAGVARAIPQQPGTWPWATFLVNLAGAFVLGWLVTRVAERIALTQYWRTLLGTGFCGALTTFSTFQIDTIKLGRDGRVGLAIAYVAASVIFGMLCASAGTVAARRGRYG